jgi:tetratricopeptide (TPR) repeat protein
MDLPPVSLLKIGNDTWSEFFDSFESGLANTNCQWILLQYPTTHEYTGGKHDFDPKQTIASRLFSHRRWALVYWDDDALVYLRRDELEKSPKPLRVWSRFNPVTRETPQNGEELKHIIAELKDHDNTTPNCLRSKTSLGIALLDDGQTTSAAEKFGETIHMEWANDNTYLNYVLTLAQMGRGTKALEIAEEGLRRYPKSVGLLDMKAWLYKASGRIEEAIQVMEQAAKLGPPDPKRDQELDRLRNLLKSS